MTASRETIDQWADDTGEPLVVFDGLDDAIVGIMQSYTKPTRVIYSYDKIITLLINQGMSYDEALDYFGFNIECLYAGPHTPGILYDLEDYL